MFESVDFVSHPPGLEHGVRIRTLHVPNDPSLVDEHIEALSGVGTEAWSSASWLQEVAGSEEKAAILARKVFDPSGERLSAYREVISGLGNGAILGAFLDRTPRLVAPAPDEMIGFMRVSPDVSGPSVVQASKKILDKVVHMVHPVFPSKVYEWISVAAVTPKHPYPGTGVSLLYCLARQSPDHRRLTAYVDTRARTLIEKAKVLGFSHTNPDEPIIDTALLGPDYPLELARLQTGSDDQEIADILDHRKRLVDNYPWLKGTTTIVG